MYAQLRFEAVRDHAEELVRLTGSLSQPGDPAFAISNADARLIGEYLATISNLDKPPCPFSHAFILGVLVVNRDRLDLVV